MPSPRGTLTTILSGGAIGSGLFIASGDAFQTGGPASVLVGFLIIGRFDTAVTAICQLMHFQVS